MMTLSFVLAMALASDTGDIEMQAYQSNLSIAAREELRLVEKVRTLRSQVEKLPDNFKSSPLSFQPSGAALNKLLLLHEVESLELQAAERWSVILNNTAYLDRVSDPNAFEARKELAKLPKSQGNLDKQVEEINLKIKDAFVLNLASQAMLK